MKVLLEERARDFHIILEDVSITDLKFSREFERAVESKQVAQQVRSGVLIGSVCDWLKRGGAYIMFIFFNPSPIPCVCAFA